MADIRLGAQSYSFRNFKLPGALDCLKQLGLDVMEFCFVHFSPDPADPNLPGSIEQIRKAGVKTLSFGVVDFNDDNAANMRKFEFAKALGVEIITANPTLDAFDSLDKLTERFGIKIAIHNHGPESGFSKVQQTLDAVKGHSPMIGACVDTGHALRSHEDPHVVIEKLGARVISVHLKDWVKGGNEQILGEGDIDLMAVAKMLKAIDFNGPAVLEYENSPDNPVPDMKIGLQNWRNVWQLA